jgi:hypothetical protein
LDFLPEVTEHFPDKGAHLVRYYDWYSHRQRGIRKKGRKAGQAESGNLSIDRSPVEAQQSLTDDGSTWAMLIKRVYEVDPLECPCCGGQMKIVSFIERCGGRRNRADSPPLRPAGRTTPNQHRCALATPLV